MSGHKTPLSPDVMHKPDATKEEWLDTTTFADEEVLPPVTPLIPILGVGVQKKPANFYMSNHISVFSKTHFWAENDS